MVPCVELNDSIRKTFRLLGRKKKKISEVFASQHTSSDSDCVSCLWSESVSCDCFGNCVSHCPATTSVMFCFKQKQKGKVSTTKL